ncbi:aprataxin and PNK-like factor [Amphibalanus amphitrite]|uniref:aprataxin and PNK-like factor n=1 Tax=Amphibalanus amphitrite TaxID=1232801 RepID=UPI001C923E27|nr:aprataxin and PNK-like factor [Amphibalanus amphitrite]
MSREELKTRIDPYLKRIDADGEDIGIPPGVTCFGRGPFLKCKDKKVSRNHGLLELASDGQIYITTIHSILYVRPAGKSEVKHLAKDEKQLLLDGDEFRLLPETFCYKLCVPNTPGTAEDKHPPTTVGDTKTEITSPNEGGRGLTEDDQPSDSLQGISQTKNTASTSGANKEEAGPAPETVLAEENRVGVTSDKTTTDTGADNVTAEDDSLPPRVAPGPSETSVLPHGAQADELTRPSHSARNQGEGASKAAASSRATTDHAAGALSNGVGKVPVINGSTRKRKLPAFLLDLDVDSAVCAAGPSADTLKKRGRPRPGGARGGSSVGRGQQRASPGTSGTPRGRGRGRQRPSERQQLSQQSDDELAPPTPPSAPPPPQSTDAAAETAASTEDPSVTKSPASKASPPQESSPTIDVGSPSDEQVTAAASASTGPAPSSSSPLTRKVAAQDNSLRGHAVSDDSGDEDDPAAASSSQRECCAYGANCFRTNPVHRRDFSHPGDADYQAPPPPPPAGQPLPECEFGVNCYRRNPLHRQQFAHTSRPNPRREAKRKARQKAKKAAAGDTPDSYDLDDSFINDSESDDYAPDDSGSDWSADKGSGSDDDDRRRRDREARRLTGGR